MGPDSALTNIGIPKKLMRLGTSTFSSGKSSDAGSHTFVNYINIAMENSKETTNKLYGNNGPTETSGSSAQQKV